MKFLVRVGTQKVLQRVYGVVRREKRLQRVGGSSSGTMEKDTSIDRVVKKWSQTTLRME